MKFYILGLTIAASMLLSACESSTGSCTTPIAGCPIAGYYGCPGATMCYKTKYECEASRECP